MVRPKEEQPSRDWMQEVFDDIERTHPVVAVRYFVEEVTPSRRVSDEYDFYWTHQVNTVVSPYFDTPEEAQKWESEHRPDKGKHLRVVQQEKRRTITEEWWGTSEVR